MKTPYRPAAVGSCFRRNDEVGGGLAEVGDGIGAVVADEEYLHAMAHNPAGNVRADGSEDSLDGAAAEFANHVAPDANGVVMVLAAGDDVLGRTVCQADLAQHPGVQKQFDGAVDGCPADSHQLFRQLLDGEAKLLGFQKAYDVPPLAGWPVSVVFQYGQQFRGRRSGGRFGLYSCHFWTLVSLS